jgi:ribosomal protein L29
MKKIISKVVNVGLTALVTASVIQGSYLILLGAAPEFMAPVEAWVNIKSSTIAVSMAPLLGSSVGLLGLKFFNTALRSSVNDGIVKTDERLSSNEQAMTSLETNVISAIDSVVNAQNNETDLLKKSLSIQNKMLEFYQIEANTKLNVSNTLVSAEIKDQLLGWQSELNNLSLELKSYELKNIYKITEVVKNIIKTVVTEKEIDPRVTEIIGDSNEETI